MATGRAEGRGGQENRGAHVWGLLRAQLVDFAVRVGPRLRINVVLLVRRALEHRLDLLRARGQGPCSAPSAGAGGSRDGAGETGLSSATSVPCAGAAGTDRGSARICLGLAHVEKGLERTAGGPRRAGRRWRASCCSPCAGPAYCRLHRSISPSNQSRCSATTVWLNFHSTASKCV